MADRFERAVPGLRRERNGVDLRARPLKKKGKKAAKAPDGACARGGYRGFWPAGLALACARRVLHEVTYDGGMGFCHDALPGLLPEGYHGPLVVALDSNALIDLQHHGNFC